MSGFVRFSEPAPPRARELEHRTPSPMLLHPCAPTRAGTGPVELCKLHSSPCAPTRAGELVDVGNFPTSYQRCAHAGGNWNGRHISAC